jgi:L-rhamnonate dehydratase
VLPDWAVPALRVPASQPWSENRNRFAVGVVADDGVTGWFGPVDAAVARIIVDQINPVLVGADVQAWRSFSAVRPAGRHRSGAHGRMAVSAVELAAWDLRSRVMDSPVHVLLGGADRTTVPAYATALGVDVDHPLAPDIAAWIAQQGFWAQKWPLPGYARDEPPRADASRLDRIRRAAGDSARICVDAGGAWDRAYGRQMAAVLAEFQVAWVEEPGQIGGADLAAFGIPCAAGEHDYEPADQLRSLTEGGLQIWQPDPAWNGGLLQSVHAVEVAAILGIPCFPHGTALAVSLRLASLMSATTVPAVEYHLTIEPLRQAVFHEPLAPVAGCLTLPAGLGLTDFHLLCSED